MVGLAYEASPPRDNIELKALDGGTRVSSEVLEIKDYSGLLECTSRVGASTSVRFKRHAAFRRISSTSRSDWK
jgi:hypothetical protein